MIPTSLIGRLVDNHGILHIIAGVGDDGDDGVDTKRILVDAVLLVRLVADQRRLNVLNAVDFVVDTVGEGVERRAHRLLTHLTLVHVTRTLVEI